MFKGRTVATSIPIEPGDFQRVRMLQISEKLQFDDVASITDSSGSLLDEDALSVALESLDVSDHARELPIGIMQDLKNLNCSNKMSDKEVEQYADEGFWRWQEYMRRRRVSASSSFGKRSFDDHNSSDDSDDGGVNKVGSLAQHVRKRVLRARLLFHDSPETRIEELDEPDSKASQRKIA